MLYMTLYYFRQTALLSALVKKVVHPGLEPLPVLGNIAANLGIESTDND